MNNPSDFMEIAIQEARQSLREGNSGFGAVVIKGNRLVAKAHDTDTTSHDPSAHAEINAIRKASLMLQGDFGHCTLVSTHEPCPMCASAIVWSGIKQVAFGFSIEDALAQGRKRINLPCAELFARAGAAIEMIRDVKKDECSLLYNRQVRKQVRQLRHANAEKLEALASSLTRRRMRWYDRLQFQADKDDPVGSAYELFLTKLGISAEEAPIVHQEKNRVVIHSQNFCPTLEACKILGLDTRKVCRTLNEAATQALLQQIDHRIRFKRNYDALRPDKPYCEEMILLEDG